MRESPWVFPLLGVRSHESISASNTSINNVLLLNTTIIIYYLFILGILIIITPQTSILDTLIKKKQLPIVLTSVVKNCRLCSRDIKNFLLCT